MGGRANHGVNLGGDQRRFLVIDMVPAAEGRAAGPDVAAVPLEFYIWEPAADVFGHPVHRDISAAGHIVVKADGLALKASQARGWWDFEIDPVSGRGHYLQLHTISPMD
jgi:hypothetical protein